MLSRIRSLAVVTVAAAAAAAVLARAQAPARRPVSLVVTNGVVVTMDTGSRVLAPGAVAIDGRDIVAVDTPPMRSRAASRRARRIDAGGQVVMPGLVNTHTHAPMVLFRGLADDLALMDWLQKYIFPAEAKTVSPEFVRAGTRLAALEMIQSGTTTYADMYYFEEEIAQVDPRRRPARCSRPDDHPVPGRRREDAGRGAGPGGGVHQGVRRRRPDHAGCRAARDVHARHARHSAVRGDGDREHAPVIIHLAETQDEVRTRAHEVQDDADRLPRVDRVLGPEDARGACASGSTPPISRSWRAGTSACRTTPRAT